MKRIYCMIYVCLFYHTIYAQHQQKTDSLLSILKENQLTVAERLEVLKDLGYAHPNAAIGLSYAKEALILAQQYGQPNKLASVFELLGTQHRLLGNKVASFEATFNALHIYEQLGKQKDQAAMYIHLGEFYIVDKDYKSAIQYLQDGKHIYQAIQDTLRVTIADINLGEAYRLNQQLDSAKICFQEALLLNQKLNDELIQGYAVGNLGMVTRHIGTTTQAIAELDSAITILTQLGDPYSVSVYQAEIGQIYLQNQQYQLAEEQFLKAFQLAEKEDLKEQIRDISKMLVDFYENRQQYKKGLQYQKVYQVYQDSLVNRENVQQLEQIKANYEIEKRETAIDTLEKEQAQQRQINIGLTTGVSLLTLLTMGLVWSYRKLSERKRIIEQREQEKALLLKELNHRAKNNLQMISSLLNLQSHQLKDHPAKKELTAGKLRVEALSLIHQKLYQKEHHIRVSIEEYLTELIQHLQLAYAEGTQLNLQIAPIQLHIDLAIPLALMINELVINAFKYAFHNTEQPQLSIQLYQDADNLQVEIQDNGIGMKPIDLRTASSFGLKLVHSLIRQLKGEINMKSTEGTRWQIKIPHPTNTTK